MQHLIDSLDDTIAQALASASAAQSAVSSHEKVCAERQSAILERFAESRKERQELHTEMREAISGIYNILWKAAFGIISVLGGLTITVIVHGPRGL